MVAELVTKQTAERAAQPGRNIGTASKLRVRVWTGAFLCLAFVLAPLPARAGSADDVAMNSAAMAMLEQQATSAQPREQCYLFSQLVHSLTEEAGREIAAGEEAQAQVTLQHADAVLAKMHTAVQSDAKRLKNAEMLMEHASRRLSDMLRVAGDGSRGAVQSTLQKLNALHTEVLAQVFAK